ncbi:MAG: hypothetical protein WD601_04965, partial [Pseudohongiellaceae bacterium]
CTAASLIVANYINVRLVSRFGPRKMMHFGLMIATVFSALLVAVNIIGLTVFWTLACFIFVIGSLGITMVNADSLILIAFPNQASSASAVTGTLRFGFGALAGPLLAYTYTGTTVPAVSIIFITITCAGALQLLQQRLTGVGKAPFAPD